MKDMLFCCKIFFHYPVPFGRALHFPSRTFDRCQPTSGGWTVQRVSFELSNHRSRVSTMFWKKRPVEGRCLFKSKWVKHLMQSMNIVDYCVQLHTKSMERHNFPQGSAVWHKKEVYLSIRGQADHKYKGTFPHGWHFHCSCVYDSIQTAHLPTCYISTNVHSTFCLKKPLVLRFVK